MNKEEFKLLFLNQFKNEDSPIRLLACQTDMMNRDDNTRYRNISRYCSKEFLLDIEINKVTTLDGFYFDIKFKDIARTKSKSAQALANPYSLRYPVLEDIKSRIYTRQYMVETISFEKRRINFEGKTSYLRMNNYVFSLDEQIPLSKTYFDLKEREFQIPSQVQGHWAVIRWFRESKNFYLDYVHDKKAQKALETFLDGIKIPPSDKQEIRHIFERASIMHYDSTMTQIMKKLSNLS